MATYAKILKDSSNNQILPYTRSKLVYMEDNNTVEDAFKHLLQYDITITSGSSAYVTSDASMPWCQLCGKLLAIHLVLAGTKNSSGKYATFTALKDYILAKVNIPNLPSNFTLYNYYLHCNCTYWADSSHGGTQIIPCYMSGASATNKTIEFSICPQSDISLAAISNKGLIYYKWNVISVDALIPINIP